MNEIGIDLGIKNFVTTSEGVKYSFDSDFRDLLTTIIYLSKHQKELDEKSFNSIITDLVEMKDSQLFDFQSTVAENLAANNAVIYIEDLSIPQILKDESVAELVKLVCWNPFLQLLEQTAEQYNCKVRKIDRFYPSSRICSNCGYQHSKFELSERTWTCPSCNTTHDRDVNAAVNILARGRQLYGCSNMRQDN